jgi:hypothetical protein
LALRIDGPPLRPAGRSSSRGRDHQIHGKIEKAEGARALNDALSTVVTGIWAEIDSDRDRLLVDFALVGDWELQSPDGTKQSFEVRWWLPPRHLNDRREPQRLRHPVNQTSV